MNVLEKGENSILRYIRENSLNLLFPCAEFVNSEFIISIGFELGALNLTLNVCTHSCVNNSFSSTVFNTKADHLLGNKGNDQSWSVNDEGDAS